MKNVIVFLIAFFISEIGAFAQLGINTDSSEPDNSAILDVKSTTMGMLIPRMSFMEQNAILNPAEGLMVLCLDCGSNGGLSIFSNGEWHTYTLSDEPQYIPAAPVVHPNQPDKISSENVKIDHDSISIHLPLKPLTTK